MPKRSPAKPRSKPATRAIDKSVEIAAAPEVVWKALTDADELKRWFPLDARVRPGKGGSIWLSWGPGCEGEAPIDEWDPPRRFRWVESRPDSRKIAVDFHLETRGGKTVVRLVNSGFGSGSSFDGEFDSTSQGWAWFLLALRHLLEVHPTAPRKATWLGAPMPTTRAAAWERLTDKGAFEITPARGRGIRERDRFQLRIGGGPALECRALLARDGAYVGGVVESLDRGLFFLEMNGTDGSAFPGILLATFGKATKESDDAHRRFHAAFESGVRSG